MIIEIAQQRRGFFDVATQVEQDDPNSSKAKTGDFAFRGGATLVFDLREGHLRYAICKRIADDARLRQQREFLAAQRFAGLAFAYGHDDGLTPSNGHEPFAFVHRGW